MQAEVGNVAASLTLPTDDADADAADTTAGMLTNAAAAKEAGVETVELGATLAEATTSRVRVAKEVPAGAAAVVAAVAGVVVVRAAAVGTAEAEVTASEAAVARV